MEDLSHRWYGWYGRAGLRPCFCNKSENDFKENVYFICQCAVGLSIRCRRRWMKILHRVVWRYEQVSCGANCNILLTICVHVGYHYNVLVPRTDVSDLLLRAARCGFCFSYESGGAATYSLRSRVLNVNLTLSASLSVPSTRSLP